MVFYKPWKTYAMVEQIRRLYSIRLVDGSQITKVKSPYGHCVDYALLAMQIATFLRSVLAKCLALAKRYY
jgi:hypothetical protein